MDLSTEAKIFSFVQGLRVGVSAAGLLLHDAKLSQWAEDCGLKRGEIERWRLDTEKILASVWSEDGGAKPCRGHGR